MEKEEMQLGKFGILKRIENLIRYKIRYKKEYKKSLNYWFTVYLRIILVTPTGFKPVTSWFVVKCAIQLRHEAFC